MFWSSVSSSSGLGPHFAWPSTSSVPERPRAEQRLALESHWRAAVAETAGRASSTGQQLFVVPMFPYPSGSLHLGHARVYTLSDVMARIGRLQGHSVIHPIGWDAFGLPAENAAIQRGRNPAEWTTQNIAQMREQLESLGCRWDWDREISTADPAYYRWTQWLLVRLWKAGLVRTGLGRVWWDPVDETLLANEQIDSDGRSWRSGAVAEERLLRQWAISTPRYAKRLREGIDKEWGSVSKIQGEWIGVCDVFQFLLPVRGNPKLSDERLDLRLVDPGQLTSASVVYAKPDHEAVAIGVSEVWNPIREAWIPLRVSEEAKYGKSLDLMLDCSASPAGLSAAEIVAKALAEGWGGWETSRTLRDWVVSRQRYWGTPIPLLHCKSCGVVPVPESELPVRLPQMDRIRPSGDTKGPLALNHQWLQTRCPHCRGPATREADTLDTFVDSSWYFLRYLNPHNDRQLIDPNIGNSSMPVDIYVGGIEHGCGLG